MDYLKPLYENEYKIKDTQSYASVINDQPPSYVDKEKVSYDVDSLFANILVEEISISGVVLITIAIKHILAALCDILFTNFLTCHFLFDNLSNWNMASYTNDSLDKFQRHNLIPIDLSLQSKLDKANNTKLTITLWRGYLIYLMLFLN